MYDDILIKHVFNSNTTVYDDIRRVTVKHMFDQNVIIHPSCYC
jgi:virulence-associated protein VapD